MVQAEHIREASEHMELLQSFYPDIAPRMSVDPAGIIVTLHHPLSGTQFDKLISWEDINSTITNPLINAQAYLLGHMIIEIAKDTNDEH